MSTLRHTIYGQCLIALIAVTCYGEGWDTNAWPAYLHSRAGKVQAINCVSAVVERANVASAAPSPLYPSVSFWRSQRGNCINIKQKIVSIASPTYRWSLITNAMGYVSFLNEHTSYPDEDVLINEQIISNKIQLCEMAKIPTNFFDYTPYRGLDGVGPFTNDTSVGHPHGWTNATTAAGGTSFPPGRSVWYTTDYGFDGVRSAISVLKNRVESQIGAVWNDHTGLRTYSGPLTSTNSWADVKGLAEAALTNGSGGTLWYAVAGLRTPPDTFSYSINMPIYNYAYQWKTNGAEPAISCLFLTYTLVTSNGVYGYDGDQIGYSLSGAWEKTNNIERAYGWQSVVASNTSASVKTAYIGSTNIIPDAPSYPVVNGGYAARGVGLRRENLFVDYMTSLLYLDYGDNFKYK